MTAKNNSRAVRAGGCGRRLRRGGGIGLLLAVMGAAAASAADTGAGVAASGDDPLDAYVRHVASEQRPRVAPLALAAGTNAPARKRALQDALLALNPELAGAFKELNDERPTAALPILDRLKASVDPFLATYAGWFRVRALVGLERYEDALTALATVQTNAVKYTLLAGDMLYTEGRLHACLLDRATAATIVRRYLREFPQAPPDRRDAAQDLLAEIEKDNEFSLSNVAALMDDSRRRLQLSDTGDLTQARQRQIAALLRTVVEKVEEKPTKGGRAAKTPGAKGKPANGKNDPNDKPTEGAKESTLDGEATGGDLKEPEEAGNPNDWARQYARDREMIQRELQTRVPERFRELVEQYYRSLSNEGKPANRGL